MRPALGVLCVIGLCASQPRADETLPAKAAAPEFPSWPRVGGHFGLALPIVAFDNDGTTVIGRDFAQVGITPGITIKIAERWAVDFEFIGFGRWDLTKPARSHTIFVVDPGVVYNFGPVAAGLRLATQIGEGVPLNFGLVPIVVVPFKVTSKLSYFLELDLPVFVTAKAGAPATALTPATSDRVIGSLTILLQTGFAF
ncbi:MAG TPA: hypothetical protein VGL86_08815 [Polyangia bacterium]|jgi:hypothetical protein